MMADNPSSYLVLASQRSGSTLLVESLRATGVAGEPQEFFQYLPATSQAPQPREWFAGVEDESILSLLDPLDPGTPDLAPAEIWRDYIRTVGRTPERRLGRQADVEPDAAAVEPREDLPNRSGDGLLPRSATSSARSRSSSMSTGPMWCRRRCRSGGRCRRGSGGAGPIPSATPAPPITPEPSPTPSPCCVPRNRAGRAGLTKKDIKPMEIAYPVLWRNLTEVVATVLEALGLDPRLAPQPVLERQADQRSDEWVDRYRADAQREGLPT